MWAIITFAVCFMLACVMLISGSGNIGETKNAIEDTIVKQEIESSFKKTRHQLLRLCAGRSYEF